MVKVEARQEGVKARSMVEGEPVGEKWVGSVMICEREYECWMSRRTGAEGW